jgi:hypothetical protein
VENRCKCCANGACIALVVHWRFGIRGLLGFAYSAVVLAMEQLFKPAPQTFDERLLDWLLHGGGATEAICAAARSAAPNGKAIELRLLEAGLGQREILRGVLDVSGRYAVQFRGSWVEQGLASLIPLQTARRLGILPLAIRHGHICCLTAGGSQPSLYQQGLAGHETELVVLGTTSDLENDLVALYAELERVDPKHDSFAEYMLRTHVVHESHRAELAPSGGAFHEWSWLRFLSQYRLHGPNCAA